MLGFTIYKSTSSLPEISTRRSKTVTPDDSRGRLYDFDQFNGRLLTYSCRFRITEFVTICVEWTLLSFPSTTIWLIFSSLGIYQDASTSYRVLSIEGHPADGLLGRFYYFR